MLRGRSSGAADCTHAVSGGGERRDFRHTSLAGHQHGSMDIKVASPCQKLAPEGWTSRTLHLLAESGVMAHSVIRLCPPDSLGSVRIPSVLICLTKYCASVTEASGEDAVMSKRQSLCFALPGRCSTDAAIKATAG